MTTFAVWRTMLVADRVRSLLRPSVFVWRCKPCGTKHVETVLRNTRVSMRNGRTVDIRVMHWRPDGTRFASPSPRCDCGRLMNGGEIEGVFREKIKCDPRCTNAKGHSCECSCGGLNHGSTS